MTIGVVDLAMAYANAKDLIELAAFFASHCDGVKYGANEDRFGVDHRQEQRLVYSLRQVFPEQEEGPTISAGRSFA